MESIGDPKTVEVVKHKVEDLPQYITQIGKRCPSLGGDGWYYRGQADAEWPVQPKAGRAEFLQLHLRNGGPERWPDPDLRVFRKWRNLAVAYCDSLPDHELECLAFAQHYGLATRLLDWTVNPLVALFFAVEKEPDVSGGVFCHLCFKRITDPATPLRSIHEVSSFVPRPFDRRIHSQAWAFTYHPKPAIPLTPNWDPDYEAGNMAPDQVDLVLFEISASRKCEIQSQLNDIGITRKALFPDLEGLSDFINWSVQLEVALDRHWKSKQPRNPFDETGNFANGSGRAGRVW